MRYDLCLPCYWKYDDAFVGMVERACIKEGISLWQIKPDNLLESITALDIEHQSFATGSVQLRKHQIKYRETSYPCGIYLAFY